MYGYVYKTTNLSNGKIYIGQHKSDEFDCFYFGSGIKISNALKKYGKSNFKCEVLIECNNKNDLDFYERKFINDLNSIDINIGYNIALGGSGAQLVHQTEETKKKISKSNSGKKRTEECKINFSKQRTGGKWINNGKEQKHVLKEEVDYYLSNGWVFGMCKKRKPHIVSEETKKKISESNKKPKKAEAVKNQKKAYKSKKYHWYTNGNTELYLSEFSEIPDGFKLGRTQVTDDFRKKCGKRYNKT